MKKTNLASVVFGDRKRWMWGAGLVVVAMAGTGCNKAEDTSTSAATVQSPQDNANAQIQSIQNNPAMSADVKQRTIAGIQANQNQGAR